MQVRTHTHWHTLAHVAVNYVVTLYMHVCVLTAKDNDGGFLLLPFFFGFCWSSVQIAKLLSAALCVCVCATLLDRAEGAR